MSTTRSIVIAAALCLLLTLIPACKRSAVEEPDPFGPGTLFISFDLFANPNVIVTSEVRETSEVRALVKIGGEPAANQTVVFTIVEGPGEFEDYLIRTTVTTNSNGYAFIHYLSPTKYEMGGYDQTVVIEAQLQTCSPYFRWKWVEIRLLQAQ